MRFLRPWQDATKHKIVARGACFMHQQAINTYQISALACGYNARGWANGQCVGLSRCSWPILQLWQYTSKHRFLNKNPKIGSRCGIGMGSKSGWAHAQGCPDSEWVPPDAGSREGVLGTLWWFPCPSCQIHAIPTDTYIYLHIPTFHT